MLGGAFSVVLAFLNHKNATTKDYFARRRELLEGVIKGFDEFTKTLSLFWAALRNAAYQRDKQTAISDVDLASLKSMQTTLFSAFSDLGSVRSTLLLLGEQTTEAKLADYRDTASEFFKIAVLDNPKCTAAILDEYRNSFETKRKEFILLAHESYKRNA